MRGRSADPTARVLLAILLALALGGCGSHLAGRRTFGTSAGPEYLPVPAPPFGVAVTTDGRHAFVALASGRVLIYSLAAATPRLERTIAVPGEALGCSLTRNGRLLLVADGGRGATVLSATRAVSGAPHPVLGTLAPPRAARLAASGAIETASSADGRFVFVSLEYGNRGGAVAVYDLGRGRRPRVSPRDYAGSVTLGDAVVGSALAPDGRELYVTSEAAAGGLRADGTLSVLDVARLEHGERHAVLATVPAGHQPVRIAVSPDGSTVWVTARADDQLLAFSAARLRRDPGRALLARTRVGTAPVGVGIFDDGARLIVADSDRFDSPGARAQLTLVNAAAALAHRPARIATVETGEFPREVAIDPRGSIALVTDFGSDRLQVVRLR